MAQVIKFAIRACVALVCPGGPKFGAQGVPRNQEHKFAIWVCDQGVQKLGPGVSPGILCTSLLFVCVCVAHVYPGGVHEQFHCVFAMTIGDTIGTDHWRHMGEQSSNKNSRIFDLFPHTAFGVLKKPRSRQGKNTKTEMEIQS